MTTRSSAATGGGGDPRLFEGPPDGPFAGPPQARPEQHAERRGEGAMIPDLVSVVAAPPGWWAFFKVDEPPGWGALPVAVWAVAKRTDAGETFLEVVPGVPDHPDDGGLLSDLSEIANYLGVWNEPTPPAGWVA